MTQPGQIVYDSNGHAIGISVTANAYPLTFASSGIIVTGGSYSVSASCGASGIVQARFPFISSNPPIIIDEVDESIDEEICLECSWKGPNFEPCPLHAKKVLEDLDK